MIIFYFIIWASSLHCSAAPTTQIGPEKCAQSVFKSSRRHRRSPSNQPPTGQRNWRPTTTIINRPAGIPSIGASGAAVFFLSHPSEPIESRGCGGACCALGGPEGTRPTECEQAKRKEQRERLDTLAQHDKSTWRHLFASQLESLADYQQSKSLAEISIAAAAVVAPQHTGRFGIKFLFLSRSNDNSRQLNLLMISTPT